jgi:Zn-dependent metalloprotease
MAFASVASGAGMAAAGQSTANAGNASSPRAVQPDQSALQRLVEATGGRLQVREDPATGVVGFLRIPDGPGLALASRSASAQAQADAFLQEYGSVFGITAPASELVVADTATDSLGMSRVVYQQVYGGVEVFATTLLVHTNAANEVTAVNGVFVPGISLSVVPTLSADAAAETALAVVAEANPGAAGLSVGASKLYVYRDGLIQGVRGPNYLVYEVEVANGASVRDFVYVDAHTGKVVNRVSGVQDDLHRELYEQTFTPSALVWQEGDPFPGGLNIDQQNIVNFSGDAYNFFFNAFGWDSYDNNGAFMRSVNNDPTIACPNANWNSTTTNYCNGVTSDDVVAHEWGHAYTEFTSNLIYQWQPGALNESYSDIWGETVDMINGEGTDSPAPVRTVNTCSIYTDPIPTLTINAPPSIAGDYAAAGAAFGPTLTETGLTDDVVLALDPADGVGPSTTDACSPLTNAAAVSGNIALVDRGTCGFVVKVKNAQNAGAVGVIVANNVPGAPSPMGGADPTITIPSIMVSQATGNLIKGQLSNGVNVTMHLTGGSTAEDSYRWLMGEDSTAFGGAIRDMWTPTCMGDPGKVSDAEYACSTADAGGVHSNSGIPNHGYSLLVDGGTYNGQTITAIGLTKAAHIYWRAQEVYQTETTKFADHADALEASCTDLLGQNLASLSTGAPGGPSGEVITAADCQEVSDMIAAVEFHTEPTQCNFQPLLQQGAPALCADLGSEPTTVFLDDFEAGLGNWTLTNDGVFSGWPNFNWVQDTSLPGGRPGAAAFAVDPLGGACDGGAGDFSGVMEMASTDIAIPDEAGATPRLAFDHYVATEGGWDGGNLKASVNGGAFTLVPSTAFTFNPYNTTLQTAAAGNTNPLAGQAAFSGTDGGEVAGSWGQSQVDLAALGAGAGDTVALRYDFGMDGCNGLDGWYVDDVHVYTCAGAVNAPPSCSGAVPSQSVILSPTGALKLIQVVGVTDPDGDPVTIMVDSIFQDEPVLAPSNKGVTSPDGVISSQGGAKVRAERVSSANGRVYHIAFTASDGVGGSCEGEVLVSVPLRRDIPAVDDGALYDSTVP